MEQSGLRRNCRCDRGLGGGGIPPEITAIVEKGVEEPSVSPASRASAAPAALAVTTLAAAAAALALRT